MARIQTGKSIYPSNSQWKALYQWLAYDQVARKLMMESSSEDLSSAMKKLFATGEEVANR